MYAKTTTKNTFIIWPKNDTNKLVFYIDSDRHFQESIDGLRKDFFNDEIDYEDYLKEMNEILKINYNSVKS